jgi:hypothetical protein
VAFFNLEDYETVEERLSKFWSDHPAGRVWTKALELSPSRFVIYAEVYFDAADPHPKATGHAEETVQGRGVNATSALENGETSAIGRALANCGYATKGKRPSREEMAKVKVKADTEAVIADAKAKMATTAKEYVPVAKEDDPWTIREAAPAATVDEAVAIVKDIIGGQTEKDVPRCTKCHDHKPMSWATGVSGKTKKPWGKFGCFVCKDVIWYEIAADGSWQPQKNKW